MPQAVTQNPILTEEEWALVGRLLEARQGILLSEIRHTDRRAFREELHRQLDMVQKLLDRLPVHEEKE